MCLVCVCLCVLRHAEKRGKPRVSIQKRLRVYIQNVPVSTGTTRTCVSTCARGAGTHGDFLNVHTGTVGMDTRRDGRGSSPVLLSRICQRMVVTCFRGSPKIFFGSFPFSSLRKDRKQHVPDFSNHSLYLIRLFSFSNLDGNFGPDGSIGLSPPPPLPPSSSPSFPTLLPSEPPPPPPRAPQQHATHNTQHTERETEAQRQRQRKKTTPKYNERFAR